jgi:hypothetical protein
LRLADHETVVVPDADDVADEARVITDGDVEGAANSPAALESLLTDEAS